MTHNGQQRGIQWLVTESVPLLRVRPGREFAVMPTGLVRSYQMHWNPEVQRTQPCVLVACPHCRTGQPRRPLSYVPVMNYRMRGEGLLWLPAILEVPHSTGITLSGLVGVIVAVKRERQFGPVLVGKYLFKSEPPKPIKIEMLDHLMPLWRLDRNTALVLVSDNPGTPVQEFGLVDMIGNPHYGDDVSS